MLAGVGVAVAVALVFAVTVANSSITSSASNVVHAVIGPADLQLHARDPNGFAEHLLGRVERLAGVDQAAPLLEQTATVVAPGGRRATLNVAGTNIGLALLDGLAHTLPLGALSPGGIGLSQTAASALHLPAYNSRHPTDVRLLLRGRAFTLKVSAVLGSETAGALSQAQVAVMPLGQLQQLAGLPGRVTRILVQSNPGQKARVEHELQAVAAGRITLAAADQDISLLHQALRPSNQASALFAGLSALLGFLFAFNAMLLTVPERRETIADMRMDGAKRTAIVQMVLFQAICLGAVASLAGLAGGYALSLGLFHQSPGYLAKAFTLGVGTVIGVQPIAFSLIGGMLATCLASLIPLQDLRTGRPLDAVFSEQDPNGGVPERTRGWLIAATAGLLLLATGLFVLVPSAAIFACVVLALATMLAVPLVLAGALRAAGAVSLRYSRLTVLPLALSSLKTTTLRSLALAATGAVALFGSVALGASRDDLLRGIDGYTGNYVRSANIWLVNPTDNQAIDNFNPSTPKAQIARIPGVASIATFQGSYLDYHGRRVWVIAWPPGARPALLDDQIIHGAPTVTTGLPDGQITVSDQIASEQHLKVGDQIALPTPTGTATFKIAATTTNFGWSPGTILMNTSDYRRAWATPAASALGVNLKPTADPQTVRHAIQRTLGAGSGLEVLTAKARETTIDNSASEGLGQLGEIATLLVAAAILAMAAALGSSIWQRRKSLAELRLDGAPRRQVRLVLLTESALMLSAGCLTGALAGVYGQVVIDSYLKQVTGFPVAGVGTGARPLEIFALVLLAVLVIVALPAWFASRVSPTFALNE
ncbi:MAG TPA: FtsX-like permease family protein [Solirubrobacteraceae bacterium]|nr:FtsX-like permease family protein [Solirubrobacteraceae bacterium]